MQLLGWALQILILTAGIHLFLRFVRTTRGSRLIRGLFVSVLIGVLGLWGLSKSLGLAELEHVVQGAAGIVVIVFAIVFQPELRRGIAQLGEHSLLGRLIPQAAARDSVHRIARAAISMARRRHGALIAFERESSLSAYVEEATDLDAHITTRLIESLFYPGAALHDGAVVIRRDRIVAAGCFFPLPQEGDIDRSMGTRHRAALGVTEETDAIVLVVSEETGSISIAQEGRIQRNIPLDDVENELRKLLQHANPAKKPEERRLFPIPNQNWKRDITWFSMSLVLASAILVFAHQDIRITRPFSVRVTGVGPSERRQPAEGELLVVLPDENYQLTEPAADQRLRIEVQGSRSQIDAIGDSLAGQFEVFEQGWTGGPLFLSQVRWNQPVLGIEYEWLKGSPPDLVVARYETRTVPVTNENLSIDATNLDPRYETRVEDAKIQNLTSITVSGPSDLVDRLGDDLALELETIVLRPEDRRDRIVRVGLSSRLTALGFTLKEGTVAIELPIVPARRDLGGIEREIALISLAPERAEESSKWNLPVHQRTARFTIQTSGLIPINAGPGSPALAERNRTIRKFVEDNLLVYADVAELPPDGGRRSLPVRWTWRKNWRKSLESLGLDRGSLGGREELDVQLESDEQVLLEAREREESDG